MGRPVTVVIGPLAAADPDGIATSQTAAGAGYLALNGALTDGQTANNVCLSQTPTAAFTLNGALCSSVPTGAAVAYLGQNSRIYFTSAANISNRTITIQGLYLSPSGLSAQSETLTGPNATLVASQNLYYQITSITISGTAAGAITVGRAGIATLDMPRRLDFTSAGDDTGITITVIGTNSAGEPISETLAGGNTAAAIATTVLSYATATSVLLSGATASTITAGSSAIADSPWIRFDDYGSNAQTTIQCVVDGTVSYTVQETMDDPNALGNPTYYDPAAVAWSDSLDTAVVAATETKLSSFAFTPVFAKVVLNSGDGQVRATFRQAYQD